MQPDFAPEVREAQARAKKLAETMAKAPAGWQAAAQGQPTMLNGELNPLVKAAQEAALKLAVQVRLLSSAETLGCCNCRSPAVDARCSVWRRRH